MNEPTSAGWTCGYCGSFVRSGLTHVCPQQSAWFSVGPLNPLAADEMRRKLDRIIELLEMIAGVRR